MPDFTIKTDDKPHLSRLIKDNPQAAKVIIQTFVQLMDEAAEQNWHELPQLFGQGKNILSFHDLVGGVLHGSLDLPDINPELYDVWREEVHPLSMITKRKDVFTGGTKYFDWRRHYRLDKDTPTTQEDVATIFRRLLRYYKFVDVESLAHALQNNQTVAWRGLENPHLIANLPFVPALRYQKEHFGDLHVGKFFDEIGAFDCGVSDNTDLCVACEVGELKTIGDYKVCPACNAGYKAVAK